MEFREGVRLADFTSWQIGGSADWFCQPESDLEVEQALRFAQTRGIPWTVLGGGSNVLISDQGVEGLVICMRRFQRLQESIADGHLVLECAAGVSKAELLKIFLKHRLAPALFLAGLPGDVGGGVVMNAGVAEEILPREFHQIVDAVEILKTDPPLRRRWFKKDEIKWTYRHSKGWQPGIVLGARLKWPLQPVPDLLEQVRAANRVRLSKQPLDQPSCGSVFVNPEGHKVGRLIDECGLKGRRVGGAMVSLKHANFIVNTGGATARDVVKLIHDIRDAVSAQKGVTLRTEVVAMGRGLDLDWTKGDRAGNPLVK